ncbi:MAG TPA: hypothetical protein VNN79_13845 [Actinomycetota bacterium]|nr:hypothetical protein [Actinomycetota bacterium]
MNRAAPSSILRGCSLALAVVMTLVGCTSSAGSAIPGSGPPGTRTGDSAAPAATSGPPAVSPTPPAATTPAPTPARVTMADAKSCPVTMPHGRAPMAGTFGNGQLRVGGLWPRGVIAAGPAYVDARGRVRMKFPWWRIVTGRLQLSGHRIDAPAPPLLPDVPTGYGPTGFQATSVTFPTPGCWRVTGRAGPASLSFVTFVIERRPPNA